MTADYLDWFTERLVTGRQLLQMTSYDIGQLSIGKVGHQERLLHSIGLLQSLVRPYSKSSLILLLITIITTFLKKNHFRSASN